MMSVRDMSYVYCRVLSLIVLSFALPAISSAIFAYPQLNLFLLHMSGFGLHLAIAVFLWLCAGSISRWICDHCDLNDSGFDSRRDRNRTGIVFLRFALLACLMGLICWHFSMLIEHLRHTFRRYISFHLHVESKSIGSPLFEGHFNWPDGFTVTIIALGTQILTCSGLIYFLDSIVAVLPALDMPDPSS